MSVNLQTEDGLKKIAGSGKILVNMEEYLKAPKSVDVTILPSNWTGSSPPYIASVSIVGATETDTVLISAVPDITNEQYKALADASIIGKDMGGGIIQLRAHGIKPDISLPIRFSIFKKGD